MMELLSINVSLPLTIEWQGKKVSTAIFKRPVTGPAYVRKTNLAGDRQADLKNHGGGDKAVYAFSFDHYAYWRAKLNKTEMNYGQFGENLTIAGLDESKLHIGDRIRIGNCLLEISQPRIPCFKLGIITGHDAMPRMFIEHGCTGIYFRVISEGEIEAGDTIEVISHGQYQIPVKTLFTSYFDPDQWNPEILATALEIPELAQEWKEKILKKLQLQGRSGQYFT